jgi:dynein light intermediate chain 1
VPPTSNRYALGYTYHDVLDADHEDILARLSIWMLSTPAPSFAPLLKPLLTPKTVPNTLVAILLDWSDPFKWPRQLRQWVRLLRSVILSLDEETKVAMEENMTAWKERRTGPDAPTAMPGGGNTAGTSSEAKQTPAIPLGPGEWEDGLGVPLSVICMNANKIERMEREFGWQEEQFDFVLQWMRCVLLKRRSSLVNAFE